MTKVLETNNYSLFVVNPFNREIKKTRWLEASLKEYGWIPGHPLDCKRLPNGKLEIRDGHNRFDICRRLKIPVRYVESKDAATPQILIRTHTPHSVRDYLTSYMKMGNLAYQAVMEYHKRTGISLSSCISLLAGSSANQSSNHLQRFKDGDYSLGDLAHSEIVGKLVIHCSAHGIAFARHNRFVQAVSKIAWARGFDLKVMMAKIASGPEFVEKQTSLQNFVRMLASVYNRNSRERVPLEFLADEAARERSPIFSAPIPAKKRSHKKADPPGQTTANEPK